MLSFFQSNQERYLGTWEHIISKLIYFDDVKKIDEARFLLICKNDKPARLLRGVTFVTVVWQAKQYVYHEHTDMQITNIHFVVSNTSEIHVFGLLGNEIHVDLCIWWQYIQTKRSAQDLNQMSISTQTVHNLFFFLQRHRSQGQIIYTQMTPSRILKSLDGRIIETCDGVYDEATKMIEGCPIPGFSVPDIVFAQDKMLGVACRGMTFISTDLLTKIKIRASEYFGQNLHVVPVDPNDEGLKECRGCNEKSRVCICEHNYGIIEEFSYLAFLCLIDNDVQEPFGMMASALWVGMPPEKTVCMRKEKQTLVVLEEAGPSSLVGGLVVVDSEPVSGAADGESALSNLSSGNDATL